MYTRKEWKADHGVEGTKAREVYTHVEGRVSITVRERLRLAWHRFCWRIPQRAIELDLFFVLDGSSILSAVLKSVQYLEPSLFNISSFYVIASSLLLAAFPAPVDVPCLAR